MIKTPFVLANEAGFHARPASVFIKAASAYQSDVTIEKDGVSYNGKSIMGLLSMGAVKGTEIQLIIEGEDEVAATEELIEILKTMQ